MLNRIVLRFPNLGCLRYIQSLRLAPECGSEQTLRNEDHVTFARGESLRRIRFADRRVVGARAGEPLGDGPQRLSFDPGRAEHDMLPTTIRWHVVGEKRLDDLPLKLRTE